MQYYNPKILRTDPPIVSGFADSPNPPQFAFVCDSVANYSGANGIHDSSTPRIVYREPFGGAPPYFHNGKMPKPVKEQLSPMSTIKLTKRCSISAFEFPGAVSPAAPWMPTRLPTVGDEERQKTPPQNEQWGSNLFKAITGQQTSNPALHLHILARIGEI